MAGRRTGKIKRRRAQLEPKVRFVLFCEGRNTEPTYFAEIKKKWTGALVTLDIAPGVGVPFTIAKRAVEFVKGTGSAGGGKRRLNSFEKRDQVWAVFDRDGHESFDETVQVCGANGIGVARSNPCFEVWLILHERDFDRPDDRHDVQKEFQKLRPEYHRGGAKVPDCKEMVNRIADAEKRAEAQRQRREEEMLPYGRPSTTVDELTKAIREGVWIR